MNEGLFSDLAELERYATDLSVLETDRRRGDISWRLGLDGDILKDDIRQTELFNWIAFLERR